MSAQDIGHRRSRSDLHPISTSYSNHKLDHNTIYLPSYYMQRTVLIAPTSQSLIGILSPYFQLIHRYSLQHIFNNLLIISIHINHRVWNIGHRGIFIIRRGLGKHPWHFSLHTCRYIVALQTLISTLCHGITAKLDNKSVAIVT